MQKNAIICLTAADNSLHNKGLTKNIFISGEGRNRFEPLYYFIRSFAIYPFGDNKQDIPLENVGLNEFFYPFR